MSDLQKHIYLAIKDFKNSKKTEEDIKKVKDKVFRLIDRATFELCQDPKNAAEIKKKFLKDIKK